MRVQYASGSPENYVHCALRFYDSVIRGLPPIPKMRSFDILVAQDPSSKSVLPDDGATPSGTRERRRPAGEVLDVFIAGADAQSASRHGDTHAGCVLRDLGFALAELGRRRRGKAIVRFYDEPWEMCVERLGAMASLSVYRAGADPCVAVYDRSVAFDEVVHSARDAIRDVIARRGGTPAVAIELEAAESALASIAPSNDDTDDDVHAPSSVTVEIDRDAPIAFASEFAIRASAALESDPSVERADLHALLFRGRLRAEIRGRAVELADAHPFLVAERLVEVSRRALESWERGIAYNVRGEAGGLVLGVRVSPDGKLALTLGVARSSRRDHADYTFPALGVTDFVEASLAFGRALVRALLRRDRAQCTNLRLSAFRRQLREASEALREVCRQDSKINPTPEPYRAFAESARARASAPPSSIGAARVASVPGDDSLRATRLRYAVRWRALVPGIDLRATFLCGDRLVVGATSEMFCLARTTGEVLWRVPATRATSVVTPGGIARVHSDGTLAVHDFGNGEVTLKTKLAPRLGGPPAGAVVHLPGLPRLLIVTEGEHHLVAIDLTSGEPRWRYTWGKTERGGRGWDGAINKTPALRMKRAGKLLYFTSGDSALTALDVLTGSVVWRVRDRLRFRASPTLDHDVLFALAGGSGSLAQLHAIDPFSGHIRWTRAIPDPPTACSIEGAPLVAGDTIALAVRERNGLKLIAFDRETGAPRWTSPGPIATVGTSWLAIDDLLIGNTPTGEVVGIDASTGELRYRQILAPRALDSDVPRRLEPVLRSGALFVPHTDVHVLRPRDGALLAAIAPCEAIPDMLRVDEHCNVYVAEESGHMVSFGALPRLSLVRT